MPISEHRKQDFLPFSPKKLISLWEMIEFSIMELIEARRQLLAEANRLEKTTRLTKCQMVARAEFLCGLNTDVRQQAYHLGLTTTQKLCALLSDMLFDAESNPPTPAEVMRQMRAIISTMDDELRTKKFAFIPTHKEQFFERDNMFGEKFDAAFPSAAKHVKAAANCLAADLNTAAVFHLMCVVNMGLLALAKHLKIKIKEIEYQEWKTIIEGLKKRVEAITQQSRGRRKEAELQFYSGLLLEFSAFKDVYRNSMAHARSDYRFHEAEGVFDRVRDFMKRLASRISEIS